MTEELREYEENYSKVLEEKGNSISHLNKFKSENLELTLQAQRLTLEVNHLTQFNNSLQQSITEKDQQALISSSKMVIYFFLSHLFSYFVSNYHILFYFILLLSLLILIYIYYY